MPEKIKVDLSERPFPGCPPGWKPDLLLASRGFDSISIENQAKAAAASWRLDPLNPANELPAERQLGYEPAPVEPSVATGDFAPERVTIHDEDL